MGNCMRRLQKRLRRKENCEKSIILLIAGLDNAGKSMILNEICGDSNRDVLPTMGFRTILLKYKSYQVQIYDVGGSSQIRGLWPKYYNSIHGLIYVVDASDISRLAENKVVFNELVSHEHISGKPILLLANKQDNNGAIDELDLVENLEVEHAANSMRCPTRVETCSCINEHRSTGPNRMGIKNGYKWLLDTITKDYTVLNSRVKDSQSPKERRISRNSIPAGNSPSKISVHSNPFKPIQELVKQNDVIKAGRSENGGDTFTTLNEKNRYKKIFPVRNKTAPLMSTEPVIEFEDVSEVLTSTSSPKAVQKGTQTLAPVFLPLKLNEQPNQVQSRPRPSTAPGSTCTVTYKLTAINIPGQVVQ